MSHAYPTLGPFSLPPAIAEEAPTPVRALASNALEAIAAGKEYDRWLASRHWEAVHLGKRSVLYRPVGVEEAAALLRRHDVLPPPGVRMPRTLFAMELCLDTYDGSIGRDLVPMARQLWKTLSLLAYSGNTLPEAVATAHALADSNYGLYHDTIHVEPALTFRRAA